MCALLWLRFLFALFSLFYSPLLFSCTSSSNIILFPFVVYTLAFALAVQRIFTLLRLLPAFTINAVGAGHRWVHWVLLLLLLFLFAIHSIRTRTHAFIFFFQKWHIELRTTRLLLFVKKILSARDVHNSSIMSIYMCARLIYYVYFKYTLYTQIWCVQLMFHRNNNNFDSTINHINNKNNTKNELYYIKRCHHNKNTS